MNLNCNFKVYFALILDIKPQRSTTDWNSGILKIFTLAIKTYLKDELYLS